MGLGRARAFTRPARCPSRPAALVRAAETRFTERLRAYLAAGWLQQPAETAVANELPAYVELLKQT